MKYTLEIEINAPQTLVIELLSNHQNMYQWQPELQFFEHLNGEHGEVGARTKLVFQFGKRKVEMIEKITARNYPNDFCAYYEAKGAQNWVKNEIVEISKNSTRWILHSEFKCFGMVKVISILFPNMFKKSTQKSMLLFKKFVENNS